MTTSTDPASLPIEPSSSDAAEFWRAIGRLEGTVNALFEGQRRMEDTLETGTQEQREYTDAGLRELRSDMNAGFREVHRRIDRMFYAFLGIGGALVVSVYASRFIGG